MNKTALLIVTVGLVIAISIVIFGGPRDREFIESNQNVQIVDGVQYITIDAKGGYWPRVSFAQAGIPTKLIVRTDATYDCSSALVIRSIGYQKILPQTGEETIDLGISKAETLRGLCSMGMYGFTVKFE